MIPSSNSLQSICHAWVQLKEPPHHTAWRKMLLNSYYGAFSAANTGLYPGSILDKIMDALKQQAAECPRYVAPQRKRLVKHFPHKLHAEIPYMNAMDALDWCTTEYSDRFSFREVTGETVQFIVQSHAARIYLKTAFG